MERCRFGLRRKLTSTFHPVPAGNTRLRCAEGLAGEVSEVGGGEAGEDQLPGAEGLIFQLQLPVGAVVAVLAVAQDGAADAGHVGTESGGCGR